MSKIRIKILIALFSFVFSFWFFKFELSRVNTEAVTYKIQYCNDGDTCRAQSEIGENIRVRLVGVDAPEIQKGKNKKTGQPFAREAKDFLNLKIQNKIVIIKSYGYDRYGRLLGEIFYNNENINLELAKAGLGEVYRGAPPRDLEIEKYTEAERTAQRGQIGMWVQKNYVSPKEFRRRKNKF